MALDYQSFFNCPTLFYRHFDINNDENNRVDRDGIVYVGNLGLGRWINLKKIGECLDRLNIAPSLNHIDVYSATQDEKIISELKHSKGIIFKGKLFADEVKSVLNRSKLFFFY